MSLGQIKGHESVKNQLKRYVESGKVPHAFLFYGIPGIGKYQIALSFFAYLNCRNNDPNCDSCVSCNKIHSGNHPDLLVVDVIPGKTSITIDQIRELIIRMKYAPIESRFKTVIINHAEQLNPYSTNALLKTLEEPPPNSVLMLVTSNIRNILPTIVSRCSLIRFSPLPASIIQDKLFELGVAKNDVEVITRAAEGSLGKARMIAEGKYSEIRESIARWLQDTRGKDPIEISEFLTDNYKDSLDLVLDILIQIQRDLISIKKGLEDSLFNPDLKKTLDDLSKLFSLKKLFDNSRLIYLTRNTIFHNNANPKIAIDNLLLNLSYGTSQYDN